MVDITYHHEVFIEIGKFMEKRLTITEKDRFDYSCIKGDIDTVITLLENMKESGYTTLDIEYDQYECHAIFQKDRPETDEEFETRKKHFQSEQTKKKMKKEIEEATKQIRLKYEKINDYGRR